MFVTEIDLLLLMLMNFHTLELGQILMDYYFTWQKQNWYYIVNITCQSVEGVEQVQTAKLVGFVFQSSFNFVNRVAVI